MKSILTISSFFLISCFLKKTPIERQDRNTSYLVYKIDSIKTVYLIYAKKEGVKYKILSQKEKLNQGEVIKTNNYYAFKLHSIFTQKEDLVTGVYYHQVPIAIERDSIMNLHEASNVRALRFFK